VQHLVFRCRAVLRRFAAAQSGNVATIFALTLPLVIGGAGLGVETAYWYFRSLQLQSAADAAAFAAELEHMSGSSTSEIESEASSVAAKNGFDAAAGSIDVNAPPTSGAFQAAAASEVILSEDADRYFTAIFSNDPVVLSARAVARSQIAARACLLALNESASKAVLFSGNSNLALTGCAVMSNSKAADALQVQGSADLTVSCLISAGGADVGNATMTACANPYLHAQPAADPFLDLPTPLANSPCKNANAEPLEPGTYCNGLTLKDTETLSAGTYVIQGDLKVNANAVVSGEGVTIYLTCGSTISINGTATVQLSAPTTGDYSGMLLFGDRTCQDGTIHTLNGTADSLLTGAIYFAKQGVKYVGDFSGAGGCTQIVAGTVEWSGNASITQDCTSLGMRDISAMQLVSLVE
jgi:hypothetical protein